MPSSTSSSSRRRPAGPWGATLALAAALAVAGVGAWEYTWRSLGHQPSVTDDHNLWSLWRQRVGDAGVDAMVVIGSSRIQLAFAPEVFRQRFPGRPVIQLAVDGTQPVATLQDLGDDSAFRGTVIWEAPAEIVPSHLDSQEPYVAYYHHNWNLRNCIERLTQNLLQSHLVTANPDVRLDRVITILVKGQEVPRFTILTLPDRSRRAHDLVTKPRIEVVANTSLLAKNFATIIRAVTRIQDRGGKVFVVRTPEREDYWQHANERYPRTDYWDAVLARTRATGINFEDIEAMRQIPCPEGAHLDYEQAVRFTQLLADEIVRLQPPALPPASP